MLLCTLFSNITAQSEDSLCSTLAHWLDLGPDQLLVLALHQRQLLVAAGLLLQLLQKVLLPPLWAAEAHPTAASPTHLYDM